jgi:hypothetical protein
MSTHRSTWKRREREAARLFGAERQPLSGSGGRADRTRSDSTHDRLFVECKMRAASAVRNLWERTRDRARGERQTPVLVLFAKGKPGALIVSIRTTTPPSRPNSPPSRSPRKRRPPGLADASPVRAIAHPPAIPKEAHDGRQAEAATIRRCAGGGRAAHRRCPARNRRGTHRPCQGRGACSSGRSPGTGRCHVGRPPAVRQKPRRAGRELVTRVASRHEPRTSLSRIRKANVPAGPTGPVLRSFTGTCRTGQRATAQGRSCRATCLTAFAPSPSNDYVGIVIVIVDALEGGA